MKRPDLNINYYPFISQDSQMGTRQSKKYRVSIKSFPDYKHLLQEKYVGYKYFF